MNNTFYVQLQARRIRKCIYPESLPNGKVCSEYLAGISEKRFYKAINDLRKIFSDYYKKAENDPASLNLPLFEVEKYRGCSAEGRAGNTALLNFPAAVFAVSLCAFVSNNALVVDIAELRKKFTELKSKRLPEQLDLLADFGFIIEGFNRKLKKSGEFTITYPDNPDLLIVLTALGDKLRKYIPYFFSQPVACYCFRLFEQFIYLTPAVFANNTERLPPKTLEHFANVAENKSLFAMTESFKERGLTLQIDADFLKNRFINQKGKDTLNFIEYGNEKSIYPITNESLALRLKLNNPDAYMEKIEALPPHLFSAFVIGRCGNCAEKCNRKIKYRLNNEEKCVCGCHAFTFNNPSADDVALLMELYDLEQNARVPKKRDNAL
ncbi:MAG: hypothetical protein FWG44_02135 [Oscillospiraceae bacterium]|nr:hypothetical protein [Oscillospiraceae bacterium]